MKWLRLFLSIIILCVISNKYGIGAMLLVILYEIINVVFWILDYE